MLQDPQVLGNDHNKPHSLMSDPISTMYFHNMFCDLLNKILFKPTTIESEVRPTGVQLKRNAKLPTVIGLTTKHAVCCNTLML